MKKLIHFFFVLSIFTACEEKPSIEGIWIGAYSYDSSNKLGSQFEPVRFLCNFSTDSVVIKEFDYPRMGEKDEQHTTFYSLNTDTLVLLNDTFLFKSVSQDSIVVGLIRSKTVQVVLKKIPPSFESTIPDLSYRAFSFTSPSYTDSLEFISDSLFLFVGSKNQRARAKHWAINSYKSMNFLVLNHIGQPPLLINDLSDDQINLTLFAKNVEPLVMKEIKSERKSADLMGKWIGVTENDSLIPPLPPSPNFPFEMDHTENLELEIGPDSLAISWGYFHWTKKYTLSATGDLLLFPDNEDIAQSKLRIIELKKNGLTLHGAILSFSPDLPSSFTFERVR